MLIAAKIDQRMQEINQRYFGNNPPEIRKSLDPLDRKLKPIIKALDSSDGNHPKPIFSSDRKEKTLDLEDDDDDDDDKNSLVAMEDQIEQERQLIKQRIDRQYFSQQSQEASISVKRKQPSVFTSTNSFEQLRDEILNHPPFQREGYQSQSLQRILGTNFIEMPRTIEQSMAFTLNRGASGMNEGTFKSEIGVET